MIYGVEKRSVYSGHDVISFAFLTRAYTRIFQSNVNEQQHSIMAYKQYNIHIYNTVDNMA